MKRFLHNYGFLIAVAGTVIVLDQLSKEWVRRTLAPEEIWSPWHWLIPYARIINWHNFGAAFGIFQNGSMVFTILAIIVSILIIYYFPRIPHEDRLLRLALGLQLGGAMGNLIDRATQGYVTDFVSVSTFPVFNVADACISIGAVLLLISVWLAERPSDSKTDEESNDGSSDPQAIATNMPSQTTPETIPNAVPKEHRDD